MAGTPAHALAHRFRAGLHRLWPGLLLAGVIGAAALFVGDQHGGPVLLYALLLGMAFNFLAEDGRFKPGIDTAARTVLRLGVALLGVRINAQLVAELGAGVVGIVGAAVAGTLAVGLVTARLMGLHRELGLLTGGATGICGASAAMAIASVMPDSPTRERYTLFAVIGVTTLSTAAMVIYPAVLAALDIGHRAAGVFIGATVHDVAQVTGAGFTLSETAGETATVTKLMRVTLLMPTVLAIAVWGSGLLVRRGGADASAASGPGRARLLATAVRAGLPWFLLVFAALAAAVSFDLLGAPVVDAGSALSRGCLVTAIAALGVKTALGDMMRLGARPVILLVIETAVLAAGIALALWAAL